MSEPIDIETIPPAPAAGQIWRLGEDLWQVLSVAPEGNEVMVRCAVFRPIQPLSFRPHAFEPETLRRFVERLHNRGATLEKGPSAPWPTQRDATGAPASSKG